MAERVRSQNDLPTLRVHLRNSRGGARTREESKPTAVFEVLRGSGTPMHVAETTTRQLGLADWIKSARDVGEDDLKLPTEVTESIQAALQTVLEPDDAACWLELSSPRGYLHLLPWERLLSPGLDRPLLRLPNFALRPLAPGPSLRVVLAVCQAPALSGFDVAEMAERLTSAWLGSTHLQVSVEVFIDRANVLAVRDRLKNSQRVTIHAPEQALDSLTGGAENEWIVWVRQAMAGLATDVVHVVCHGMFRGEHGALSLPSISNRSSLPRPHPVTAVDLCRALGRIGAWSFMISAPPLNHCPPGLRDLADTVAHARPGVVALHDLSGQDAVGEMRTALQMIYTGVPPLQPLPAIACWSHPAFVAFPEAAPLYGPEGTSSLFGKATHQMLSQADTPAWVASGARTLEVLQAQTIPARGQFADPQAVAALQAVSKLFDEHVRAYALHDDSGSGSSNE